MTSASLLCALALLAGPTGATAPAGSTPASAGAPAGAATGAPPATPGSASTDATTHGAAWFYGGGVALLALTGARTLVVPLGATIPLPKGPTLSFELTYYRWSCTGTATCAVNRQDGFIASGGFHFDTEGKGPLNGFFLSPKLQLSTLARNFADPVNAVLSGRSFGLELGLDLGYQWRTGPLYLVVMAGVSGGFATHHPSGVYGMLVEWNGSAGTHPAPQAIAPVFGFNGNVLRLGVTF